MSDYVSRVSADLQQRYAGQPEYLQAVLTWLEMIAPALEDNPIYERVDLLTRMVEPDRMLTFTVPWMDDQGMAHTNHGYRVQFNSAIGPYKGGLRFHPSVNPSIVKFLGFEQTYKNALTGLPIGGAAGGADFDPRGKSSREIMRFCQSFMTALYRLIGADTDIPAGDIGVGSREIGYLYGQYKRLTGKAESSALTGKGLTYGGSVIRQEAAGFGTVYFLARMLEHQGETLEGKRLAVSGFGNMSWGVCRKSAELGGKVVTLSGPDGYVYDPDGVCTQEKFDFMLSMRAGGADKVEPYADRFGVEFFPGKRPWEVPVDIVIPCATQNELDVEDAVMIVANNVRYYVEAANMPATAEALRLLRLSPKILTAGSKASGSGGVVVSALEMVQNSLRYSWTRQEVDSRLKQIMGGIYDASAAAAEEYPLPVIVFDFGTATTVTVVDEQRRYRGGVILPGIKLGMQALFTGTAQLPDIRIEAPAHVICTETVESLQAGAVYGAAAMTDGLVERMESELGRPCTAVVTGGLGRFVVPHCRRRLVYDEHLLLRGLGMIWRRAQGEIHSCGAMGNAV